MYFDNIAKEWDTPRRIKRAKIISEEMLSNLNGLDRKNVMEFGCGTGLISFNLVDKMENITLIDSSEEMIDIVNKKICNLGLKNINSKCCDINNVSIKEKYDIIYSSMALHHIVDVKNLINKLYNLINEDGALCIVDLNEEDGRFHKNEKDFNGHNGFNQKWLRDIIKEVGFKSVTSYTFYNGMKNIDDEVVEYSLFILLAVK